MMENVEMSWAEIVEEARATEEQWLADGSMAWYRGHADVTWALTATLHREVDTFLNALAKRPPRVTELDLLRSSYKKEYRRFRSSAWPLLGPRERSDWGIVFAMQHYGQITRLLDWSESLACAVPELPDGLSVRLPAIATRHDASVHGVGRWSSYVQATAS